MPLEDTVRLRHMLDAATEAITFIEDHDASHLPGNRQLALSLVQLLEIVGEAAKGVSDETRLLHPELPWKQMTGMRDRLIHRYYDVDWRMVWLTVSNDLPPLVERLRLILPKDAAEQS